MQLVELEGFRGKSIKESKCRSASSFGWDVLVHTAVHNIHRHNLD